MMYKKKFLAIMMSLTLALSITGCGNVNTEGVSSEATVTDGESSSDSQSTQEEFEKIDNTESNILELGAKQTAEIKEILEKYGVLTAYNADKNVKAQVRVAKDETDSSIKGTKGYNVSTSGTVKVNDGGDHDYEILYNAYLDENTGEPRYLYRITINYPTAEEFKLDNFNMFKELVKEVNGDDYDFTSLESWMKDQLTKKQSGEKQGGATRNVGSYTEGLEGGDKKAGKEIYSITYVLSLRE